MEGSKLSVGGVCDVHNNNRKIVFGIARSFYQVLFDYNRVARASS